MRLYHRTTENAARALCAGKPWVSKENAPGGQPVFFSTRPSGNAEGYGDVVVSVDVPKRLCELNDVFPNGEEHYVVLTKNLKGRPVRRANPKLGKHPDLYETYQRGYQAEDTGVVVEDWRDLTPAELLKAAEMGELSEEDYDEMEGYEDADTTPGDLDDVLQSALLEGLREECLKLDESAQERRIKPLVDELRGWMNGSLEMEYGNEDGEGVDESYVDMFQSALDVDSGEISTSALIKAAGLEEYVDLDEETLDEILRDPGLYEIVRKDDEYRRVPGSVWSMGCGTKEDQIDSTYVQESPLREILHGGTATRHAFGPAQIAHTRGEPTEGLVGRAVDEVVDYPGMSDEDLRLALKELGDDEPYISINVWGGPSNRTHLNSGRKQERDKFTVDDLDDGFTMLSSKYESSRIHAIIIPDAVTAAVDAKVEEQGGAAPKRGREHDDIVYEYAGNNSSVAGASARDMYVARLTARDLRHESAVLGHCIGAEQHGHPKALREGRTQVYSIRTEVGKPKFTIELEREPKGFEMKPGNLVPEMDGYFWVVVEIKGKANRLPGFEAGADREGGKGFTKPDDLRLVTDFLMHLGFATEYLKKVRDIAPGIEAAKEKGIDVFAPPPKRAPRPARENPFGKASAKVARLLAATRPMGAFRSLAVMSDEDAELLRIKGLCFCGHGRAAHTPRGCERCREVSITACPSFLAPRR